MAPIDLAAPRPPAIDLSDAEVEELDRLLDEWGVAFDVSAVDGFLCAVIVQPEPVSPPQWLSVLRESAPGEASAVPFERIEALATRRHDALRAAIVEDGFFDPWVFGFDEQHPPAVSEYEPAARLPVVSQALMPWVAGFQVGVEHFPALAQIEGSEVPAVLARLYRHLPAADALEQEVVATLDRENPLAGLDEAIDDLVGAVVELADLSFARRYRVETVRRTAPKVGRNDPCPCGSGRKFKLCHGAT
jgi:uncharacterized protein